MRPGLLVCSQLNLWVGFMQALAGILPCAAPVPQHGAAQLGHQQWWGASNPAVAPLGSSVLHLGGCAAGAGPSPARRGSTTTGPPPRCASLPQGLPGQALPGGGQPQEWVLGAQGWHQWEPAWKVQLQQMVKAPETVLTPVGAAAPGLWASYMPWRVAAHHAPGLGSGHACRQAAAGLISDDTPMQLKLSALQAHAPGPQSWACGSMCTMR
jgi:hypothetical protein